MQFEPDAASQIAALRERLTNLSEASLRITESLDYDSVLREVAHSARGLTDARYGVVVLLDECGGVKDFLSSGMTDAAARQFWELPGGMEILGHLSSAESPLRLPDFHRYVRDLHLPAFNPPFATNAEMPFLAAPIRHQGRTLGFIYLGDRQDPRQFSQEDEETLVMFASQAGMVIANAQRYRDEQRARSDLEALVNTSPVGVLVFDVSSGRPVYINREARRLGTMLDPSLPAEALLEVTTVRRADGQEIPLDQLPVAQAMKPGETLRAEEIVIGVPDGPSVTTLMNATPILSAEGQVESFVVTLQDLTPMEELATLRSEFLGLVSQELRAPIASIKGSIDTLTEPDVDLDPAETRQFLNIIRDQSNHMRNLVTDLLDLARIGSGTLNVSPEPVQVFMLVDEAKRRFLNRVNRRDLHIDLPPNLPPVMADRRRVVQVLHNLMDNAAQFSGESSGITVSAHQEDVLVAITVADEGAGISPERMPSLFQKYFPGGEENDGRSRTGTGLGLAICKGIVEAHGGRIWAESDGPGTGSRFVFTIPALESSVQQSLMTAHSGLRSPDANTGASVLVVDDDPQTLLYVRDALTKAGYGCIAAGTPEDAMVQMRSNQPDLVLMDLVLPGIDGIELMGRLQSISRVPVVFLSAYGQDQVIAQAFDMGAADYMVKPFSPTELVARIGAALRRPLEPPRPEPAGLFSVGELTLDYDRREVTLDGEPLDLTPIEYGVLRELAANGGQPVTYDELLRWVWTKSNSRDRRLVRTVVRRLRRKLGDDGDSPNYILTESRVGYRMAKT